jgi:hypothetical protein
MKHTEKADLRSQVLRIGGNLDQRFSACPEQKVVESLLVLQCQRGQVVRNRENYMKVRNFKQVFSAFSQPLLAGVGLTLRAVPIPTGNGELSITCLMGSLF